MGEHGQTRAHVRVSEHVQNVYYQTTTRDTVHDRGVDGWVKNLLGDRVKAVFEDPRDDVEAMTGWYHKGNPIATVEDVGVTSEEPDGETGFRIER